MNFRKIVVKELLKVRGIDNPSKYYGHDRWNNFMAYLRSSLDNIFMLHISCLKYYSDLLDVPPKFLLAIYKLERIEEIDKTR